MDSFDRSFNLFKIVFALVAVLIIGGLIFKVVMIVDAKQNDKPLYEVNVNTFNQVESYTTTSYTRDKQSGCIEFKDEFGIQHIVCNNYTITKY